MKAWREGHLCVGVLARPRVGPLVGCRAIFESFVGRPLCVGVCVCPGSQSSVGPLPRAAAAGPCGSGERLGTQRGVVGELKGSEYQNFKAHGFQLLPFPSPTTPLLVPNHSPEPQGPAAGALCTDLLIDPTRTRAQPGQNPSLILTLNDGTTLGCGSPSTLSRTRCSSHAQE